MPDRLSFKYIRAFFTILQGTWFWQVKTQASRWCFRKHQASPVQCLQNCDAIQKGHLNIQSNHDVNAFTAYFNIFSDCIFYLQSHTWISRSVARFVASCAKYVGVCDIFLSLHMHLSIPVVDHVLHGVREEWV